MIDSVGQGSIWSTVQRIRNVTCESRRISISHLPFMNMNGTYIPIEVIKPDTASKMKVDDLSKDTSSMVARARLIASGNTEHAFVCSSIMSL